MAITVSIVPNNISNIAAFTAASDLVEDTTHVNMRIRADITVDSVIIASVEKPVALPDFDFTEILSAMVPGISFARNAGAVYNTTGGSPLVAYTVLFTEVYEVAGVTTEGGTSNAGGVTFKHVPAKGDELAFSTYVLSGGTSRFANKTLRDNVCKFYTVVPMEYWIVFFTEQTSLTLNYSKDGASYSTTSFTAANGWGVIVVNATGLMSGVTNNLRIYISGGGTISEVMTIYIDTMQIDERVVLEFDGLLGGKEYLAFEGIKKIDFGSVRSYYTASTKNKKPLSFFGINKQTLETRFKDMPGADYLKSLLISMDVKKLEASYATPTDVTVTTDTITTGSSSLISNQINIESAY